MLICGEYSLEEIVLAEDLTVSGETLVTELPTTFAAFKALRVPCPVQHLQDEAVQNQLLTASTFWDAGCNRANTGYTISDSELHVIQHIEDDAVQNRRLVPSTFCDAGCEVVQNQLLNVSQLRLAACNETNTC